MSRAWALTLFLLVTSTAPAQVPGPADPGAGATVPEPDMVRVDGGLHEIGSFLLNIRDNPVRQVCLAPFSMARHEVTFREFDRFTAATGGRVPHDLDWGRDERPVVGINRAEAEAYAQWLSEQTGGDYRLPTEEEWEVAARGHDSPVSQYVEGQQAGELRANCAECESAWSGESTAPVGRFPANTLGLHDVHGNVREWTASCYREVRGGCSVGVVKGGSWDTGFDTLRFSHRAALSLRSRSSDVGFRLLREVPDAMATCEPGG
ncbi:MAG: formylglycine-generating enzyme family protein [Pseudomonadota bacterium]